MEKEEMEKVMAGKTFAEMNRHELAVAGADAVERVTQAREKLGTAFESMPAAAKMAAGDQLTAAYETLTALADLQLVTAAQVGFLQSHSA